MSLLVWKCFPRRYTNSLVDPSNLSTFSILKEIPQSPSKVAACTLLLAVYDRTQFPTPSPTFALFCLNPFCQSDGRKMVFIIVLIV